jgi:DNA-binding response OmpR family regulator
MIMETKRTALVVDDSDVVRNLLRVTIRPLGFEVVEAHDGVAGLEVLRERPVDLVITDLCMPKVDGLDFVREIRGDRHLKDLPLLMLTAQDDPEERLLALQAGVDAFLTKDTSPSVIRRCIRALLRPGAPGPFHRGGAFGGLARPTSLARALFVGLEGTFASGLGSLLMERGYAVVESKTSDDALEWLDSAGPVEICIVNGDLPSGEGMEFVRRVRRVSRLDGTRVMVLLSRPSAAQVMDAAQAGADDCVSEAIGPDDVIRRIEEPPLTS